MEKTYKIENFIGIYDNFIMPDDCQKAIDFYERRVKFNETINRTDFEKAGTLTKQDQQFFANEHNIDLWWEEVKTMMMNFDIAFQNYLTMTGAKEAYCVDQFF